MKTVMNLLKNITHVEVDSNLKMIITQIYLVKLNTGQKLCGRQWKKPQTTKYKQQIVLLYKKRIEQLRKWQNGNVSRI